MSLGTSVRKGWGVGVETDRCGWVFPRQECEDCHSEVSGMSHNLHTDARPHIHTEVQSDAGKSTVT